MNHRRMSETPAGFSWCCQCASVGASSLSSCLNHVHLFFPPWEMFISNPFLTSHIILNNLQRPAQPSASQSLSVSLNHLSSSSRLCSLSQLQSEEPPVWPHLSPFRNLYTQGSVENWFQMQPHFFIWTHLSLWWHHCFVASFPVLTHPCVCSVTPSILAHYRSFLAPHHELFTKRCAAHFNQIQNESIYILTFMYLHIPSHYFQETCDPQT